MNYLVVGVGGTGGPVGGFLANIGKDVTFLVREGSETKKALEQDGLILHSDILGDKTIKNFKIATEANVPKADVILVCVKGYSIEAIIPAIAKACHKDSIIIPILNIFGTGSKLQEALPNAHVLDGCIYIVGYQKAPGIIYQHGSMLRMVFGERDGKNIHPYLNDIVKDLKTAGIEIILSEHILDDTFQKFILISSMAAGGAYYDATSQMLTSPGEANETLKKLIGEIAAIGKAMNITVPNDIVSNIINTCSKMPPDTTTSFQKDIKKGGQSEIEGLILEPIRLGKKWNVPTPTYEKIASKLL